MALIRPNMVFIITGIIILLIVLSLAQEANRRWQVQTKIRELQIQVDSMQKHVVELQQLNEYFRTPDYQERIAREQLNYRAPGEKVVLIPEISSTSTKPTPQGAEPIINIPTPLKWWYLFFVPNTHS